MDHSFDYLLPTCMLRSRALGNHGNRFHQENSVFNFDADNVFNDTLKALESDTCSEISDKSYADASYYTCMKINTPPPYIEKQFWSDLDNYKAPWERHCDSQFDRSLQQFLEWPENCNESDVEEVFTSSLDFNDVTRLKRKSADKKRRSPKSRMINQKRIVIPKLMVNSNTACFSDTDADTDDLDIDLVHLKSNHCLNNNRVTDLNRNKIPKCNKSVDSDSDYRTYSDTSSCDKIDLSYVTTETYDEADFKSLKYLTASIVHKSQDIFHKLYHGIIRDKLNVNKTKGVCKITDTMIEPHGNKVSFTLSCPHFFI